MLRVKVRPQAADLVLKLITDTRHMLSQTPRATAVALTTRLKRLWSVRGIFVLELL